MTDPWDVLGLDAAASPEDIARAYREAAKRHHPDRAGDDGERMKEINAAYALLLARENPGGLAGRGAGNPRSQAEHPYDIGRTEAAAMRAEERRAPGDWLPPEIRRALGPELLSHLTPGEPVKAIADAVTWDSHAVRLAATDRRLIWLRDDVPTERVRSLPFRLMDEIATRERGRRRKVGELRIRRADRKRPLVFAEMEPPALRVLLGALPAG